MSPSLAVLAFAIGVCGLFYLDRDKSAHPSKALWLPVIWLWTNAGRSPSAWFGMDMMAEGAGQLPDTSLLDQSVAGALMLIGLFVLYGRRKQVKALLRRSWPITLFFGFALASLVWSDFPVWGFKRWVRASGELSMVLILATESQPAAALSRFLSRVGFVLLPFSVMLIKYVPHLGRGYDQWGLQTNVGVTSNKNTLGVLVYVATVGACWQLLGLLRDRKQPNRNGRLVAQSVLLGFGIQLLIAARSATSIACFGLGAMLLILSSFGIIRRRPSYLHAIAATILIVGTGIMLSGGRAEVVGALGRNSDFTGRTQVWEALIPMAPNMLLGAGFETFWLGPRVEKLRSVFGFINESHNGYLEVYLNLGLVGLCLLAVMLIQGYRTAAAAFRHDPGLGSLLIAFVFTAAFYSVTEAGFRMLIPIWFFLLLSIVTAARVGAVDLPVLAIQDQQADRGYGKGSYFVRRRAEQGAAFDAADSSSARACYKKPARSRPREQRALRGGTYGL